MKKLSALLFALCLLLSLAACGSDPAESGEEAPVRGMPSEAEGELPPESASGETEAASGAVDTVLDPGDLDLDLSVCQPPEVFREIEHLNIDPRGYVGLRLRLTGEVSRFVSHDKTFVYVGVRDEDGCIENLELRFPGDGSLPAGFPEDGALVTVWGRVGTYEVERGGERTLCPVLTDVQFSLQTDFRD